MGFAENGGIDSEPAPTVACERAQRSSRNLLRGAVRLAGAVARPAHQGWWAAPRCSRAARAPARASGYRVSMVCLDYGQPDRAVVDGVTRAQGLQRQDGLPVVRFLHPRLTSIWRAARGRCRHLLLPRGSMLSGFVAEFCRRHGKRSIYAGASDIDFMPGKQPDPLRARPLALPARPAPRGRDRGAERGPASSPAAPLRPRGGADPELLRGCRGARAAGPRGYVLWVGTVRAGKRPELLLELARRLPQQRFVMVGGTQSRPRRFFERIRAAAAACPTSSSRASCPSPRPTPVRRRARVRQHLALRGHAQHLPAGLGARRADARHRRRRRAGAYTCSRRSRRR